MNEVLNPNKLARKAGLLYLLLVPLGILGIIYAQEFLMVAGDSAATLANIIANESMYRLSIVAALAIQVVQLFVAVALYDLFKPVNKRIALFIVLFTITAMPIAMLNELSQVAVLYLIGDNDLANLLTQTEVQQWVGLLLDFHIDGIMIAHVFWGFWLIPMGYLTAKSNFAPKIFGWLLMFGGFSYVADSIVWLLLPESSFRLAEISGWGEILLPLWLAVKGVNVDRWHEWQESSE